MRLPQRALTLSTPRRVSASSITSSWHSEPTCTSSTETPPRITSGVTARATAAGSWARAAADATVKSGRARLPPAVMRCPPIWVISSSSAASDVRQRNLYLVAVLRHPGKLHQGARLGHVRTLRQRPSRLENRARGLKHFTAIDEPSPTTLRVSQSGLDGGGVCASS